jgi:2-amino-4-hydroxy-6-hydroxymethyldihydropteridine diphosphokinase
LNFQPSTSLVGIALGSNLGDRGALLEQGFAFLRSISATQHFLSSSIFETEPVDCPPGSPTFLNAAAEIVYAESPRELLNELQAYESDCGRARVRPINAPRPLDLDILYFGSQVVQEPDLIIPHPRLTQRRFVLEPLAQIRPELILPHDGKRIEEHWHDWQKNHG